MHCPCASHTSPSAAAASTNACTTVVLPIPGSPVSHTTCRAPSRTCASHCRSWANTPSRPTTSGGGGGRGGGGGGGGGGGRGGGGRGGGAGGGPGGRPPRNRSPRWWTVWMNRGACAVSPSALRNSPMHVVSTPSLTTVSGQTACSR